MCHSGPRLWSYILRTEYNYSPEGRLEETLALSRRRNYALEAQPKVCHDEVHDTEDLSSEACAKPRCSRVTQYTYPSSVY